MFPQRHEVSSTGPPKSFYANELRPSAWEIVSHHLYGPAEVEAFRDALGSNDIENVDQSRELLLSLSNMFFDLLKKYSHRRDETVKEKVPQHMNYSFSSQNLPSPKTPLQRFQELSPLISRKKLITDYAEETIARSTGDKTKFNFFHNTNTYLSRVESKIEVLIPQLHFSYLPTIKHILQKIIQGESEAISKDIDNLQKMILGTNNNQCLPSINIPNLNMSTNKFKVRDKKSEEKILIHLNVTSLPVPIQKNWSDTLQKEKSPQTVTEFDENFELTPEDYEFFEY